MDRPQYSQSHSHCEKAASVPCTPIPSPRAAAADVCRHGRKRTAVAKGIQSTMSKTSMLVNFLPTGTLLMFEMLLPSSSGDGTCSHVSTMMINVLLLIYAGSCFFFHFTDSFRAPDGNVYYGFVTPSGLALFKSGLGIEMPKDDRYKMTIADLVHALMSVMVFAAIAFQTTA
ncbi:hypothetical protein LUZ60_000324 [Juncus effusus]|nr:hypothetical protein LUZ60_000324 [Juncus effusus]